MALTGNESHLKAMGIQLWHARFDLPNAVNLAAVPVPVEEPSPVEISPNLASETPSTQTPVLEEKPTVPKVAPKLVVEDTPVVQTPVVPVASEKKTKDVKSVRFELAVYMLGNAMLIESVPEQTDLAHREFSQKLAVNILKAIHRQPGEPVTQLITWPLFEHPNAPKDQEAASSYLKGKLQGMKVDRDVELVIYSGRSAADLALGESLTPGEKIKRDGVDHLVTYSLGQLLNSPAMKADFWDQISAS